MSILMISPHLDDAALSFGASIAELVAQGGDVLVYTVFAGVPRGPLSPAAERCHAEWGLGDDAVSRRREEDLAAMRILDATPLHGDYLDAIYRRVDDGGWLIEGSTKLTLRQTAESDLVDAIAGTVLALMSDHRPTSLVTCSAIGGHVDHQRARDAAIHAGLTAGVPVHLWEDFPYGSRTEDHPPLPAGASRGEPVLNACGDKSWAAKIEAVGAYTSQLAALEDKYSSVSIQASKAAAVDDASRGEVSWPVLYPTAAQET